mgnify:CR=1 FL=1
MLKEIRKMNWKKRIEILLPLAITFLVNSVVYWGAPRLTGDRKFHDLSLPVDSQVPLMPVFLIIYFGCYIFWIVNYVIVALREEKKKYQFLKKLLKSDSLQNEILQVGKDYDDIIGKYGSNLYRLNKFELKYSEMGQRLASQRNHFAHGDLDKDFIGYSLLDLIYMQYIVYAMQLRYYGVSDQNIRRAINELFGLNYYFNDNNEENDLK